ncbi:MAG: Ig-like domain-containing protein, partial [Chloroflexota bacterium]
YDVGIDGDTIVISPLGVDRAFLFVRPGGGWTDSFESARLQVNGESLDAVAVSGDIAAVLGNAIHLFEKPGGGWSGTLAPEDTLDDASYTALALDGNRLVAGSTGEAFIYARDADGVWGPGATLTLTAVDPFFVDFGHDVAISGGTIAIGAEQTNGATGAAYLFESVTVDALDANANTVLWAQETYQGQALMSHDSNASAWQRATLASPTQDLAYRDLALNEAGTAFYWSEYDTASPGDGRIRRADLPDGGNATTIVATGPRPHSLALNELDDKLYWTTDLAGDLYEANLDGSGSAVLYAGLNSPGGLALLPVESAVYWVEQNGGARVMRGDLAAVTPTAIISLTTTLADIAADQNYLPVAADQSLSTPVNEPILLDFDAYDPDGDPLTFSVVDGPTNGDIFDAMPDLYYVPGDDFTGIDSFTYRADDGRGGSAEATVTVTVGGAPDTLMATDVFTQGTNLTLNIQSLDDYTPNPRDSIIFTPTNGAVITTGGQITIEGAAYAFNGLQGVIIWANSPTVIAAIPYNGVITDTTWSFNWTPPGDGRYVLESGAAETGSILEEVRTPITILVDTVGPSIGIDSTVISGSQQIAGSLVEVSGTASDLAGISRVEFRYETPGQGYGPWQLAEYDPDTGQWHYKFALGTLLDGETVSVGVRAIDFAGNVAETGDAIIVDVVPPAAVDWSAAYQSPGLIPLEPGDLVPLAKATLSLTWDESSDGSFSIDYVAGWSNSPDPTHPWTNSGSYSGAGQHNYIASEAQTLYAHLKLEDSFGNKRYQTIGPIYIDGPLTPDLVSDLDYHGWLQNDNTLLSEDFEIQRHTPPSAARHQTQRLYGSWDDNALRLAWQGAAWDSHGDLFLYLNTTTGGTDTTYDPFNPAAPPISLPAGFGADFAVWIQDAKTATLLYWTGAKWAPQQALDGSAYRSSIVSGRRTSDVLLPFSLLGITNPALTSAGVVALAVEEGALRTWAAAPDQNPLNSSQVVDALAASYTQDGYRLTQAINWPSLANGAAPNEGFQPGSDLHVTISASPGGVSAAYLDSDWLDLLQPGTPLDADLDGLIDVALPAPAAPLPLGNGSNVTYTISISNEGTSTAFAVQLDLTPRGALDFVPFNPVFNLAPGQTETVIVPGTIDTSLDGEAAELNAVVSDLRHGPFEWLWSHHPVDSQPPADVAITTPISYALPFTNTFMGVVSDTSGVPLIDLQLVIIEDGAGALTSVQCPDDTPYDGRWQCPVNLGSLVGKTGVEMRARGTDSFGQVGPWSQWRIVAVDNTPPTLSLSADVDLLLQDGFLSPSERLWRGLLVDDLAPKSVEACVAGQCTTAAAPAGNWQLSLPLLAGDGLMATVVITGQDSAGNLSTPLVRDVVVDTVAPVL